MFEVFFLSRDDWGVVQYRKYGGMIKKLQTAIKHAKRLGDKAYVKKYGEVKPVFINGDVV